MALGLVGILYHIVWWNNLLKSNVTLKPPIVYYLLLFPHPLVDCFVHVHHYLVIFVVSTFNRNLLLALAIAIIAPLGVNAQKLLLYL